MPVFVVCAREEVFSVAYVMFFLSDMGDEKSCLYYSWICYQESVYLIGSSNAEDRDKIEQAGM